MRSIGMARDEPLASTTPMLPSRSTALARPSRHWPLPRLRKRTRWPGSMPSPLRSPGAPTRRSLHPLQQLRLLGVELRLGDDPPLAKVVELFELLRDRQLTM